MPCRFNRRRTWTHRLMLETLEHEGQCCFVTLTYAPNGEGGPFHLAPKDTQRWLKRFRKAHYIRHGARVRYYLVGEYGDVTQRPHYHAALFGVAPCTGGPVISGVCRCVTCSDVRETWGFGHIHVAELNIKTAQYLCGYVTKKMTHRDDPRLYGREPEFARMSNGGRTRTGGIGAAVMWNAASELMLYNLEKHLVDVPHALDWSGKSMPLGRYLRSKLRTYVGRNEKAPALSLVQAENQLLEMRAAAWVNNVSTKQAYYDAHEPYARTLGVQEKMKGKKL